MIRFSIFYTLYSLPWFVNSFAVLPKSSTRPFESLSSVVSRQSWRISNFLVPLSSVTRVASSPSDDLELQRVPPSLENVPLPFIDPVTNSFIECYADSVVTVQGVTYTIAVPCDYSVALCYFDADQQLIPVELNDPLMDDIFPIAESIVAEEFGEELVLQRTPQTLTLVGELELDDEDDAEEDAEDEDESEEVEVLLSFEHREQEFSLVRLLDPILLVGKDNPDDEANAEEEGGTRLLLTPDESETVMPVLEDLFLKYHDNVNNKMP
jgi:Protein of unknown function (DUF3727)